MDVGFDSKDLAPIWNDLLGIEDDGIDIDKELEEIGKGKVKPGDLYKLGRHRLLCASSTDIESVRSLVGEEEVNVLYCDPPYNISLDYDKGFGKESKYGGKVNDSKSIAEYETFIAKTLENGLSVCSKDAHIFYYCDENYIWLVQGAFRKHKVKLKRVCLWIKNNQNPTPQTAFNKCYEPCVYGTVGRPHLSPVNNLNEVLNTEIGTGTDTIDDISNLWTSKRLNTSSYEHPTEKPPTLHERPLRRCTKPGQVVLDLFGGSGSTLIACEQLGRKALIVEMSPIFCELIIRRYEKLTGNKARKVTK
jgi:DNA modification methylase